MNRTTKELKFRNESLYKMLTVGSIQIDPDTFEDVRVVALKGFDENRQMYIAVAEKV